MSRRTSPRIRRAQGLFVVRESDQYDLELFDAMRHQTYVTHDRRPEVAAVMKLGLEPLSGRTFTLPVTRPDGTTEYHSVVPDVLTRGRTTAVLFEFGGYWHLWSQGSAATETRGVNEFTEILVEQTKRLKPVTVYAAGISRLIRSQRQGNLFMNAFDGNVDLVVTGESEFPFAGSAEKVRMGKFAFSMLCQIASWERDWIVQRLLAGRISKWRRDEWAFGRGVVPFGYRLDADKRLVPDPERREQVAGMLRVLAMNLPASECVRRLDELGVVSAREQVPYGQLKNANVMVQALYAWAPLYCGGEFLTRVRNVFPGFLELNGLTIMRHQLRGADGVGDDLATGSPGEAGDSGAWSDADVLLEDDMSDCGEFQMLYRVGVPDGGWAEAEVLEAFANAAIAKFAGPGHAPRRPLSPDVLALTSDSTLLMAVGKPTGKGSEERDASNAARSRETISLLTGRSWEDDEWAYELNASSPQMYVLSRQTRKARGTERREVLARLRAEDFIQGFVKAFVAACRDGVPARTFAGVDAFSRSGGTPHESQEELIAAYRQRIDQASAQCARATDSEVAADDPADKLRYRAAARAQATTMARLEARLATLLERRPDPAPESGFDAFADVLLPAFKRLQTCGGRVTQAEYLAFNRLVPRLEVVNGGGMWRARAWLRVRIVDGVADLGPVEWEVGAGGYGASQVSGHGVLRMPATKGRAERRLRLSLVDAGCSDEAALTLLNCPFPELPQTVLHGLTGDDLPDDVGPEWRETKFKNWVTATYADPNFTWRGQGKYTRLYPLRQLLAYYAVDHDTFTPLQAFADLPMAYPQAVGLMAVVRKERQVRAMHPVLTKVPGGVGRSPLLSGVRCECGQVATVVARVPEVPRDLLCECGLMPAAESFGMPADMRFPRAYMSLRLSREDALARTNADYVARKGGSLTKRDRQVLELLDRRPGLTDKMLSETLSVTGMHQSLSRLLGYGYVNHDGERPKHWRLSPEGKERL